MATGKRKCNLCGNEFDGMWEGIHETFGYGSQYDGLMIDFDLCDCCLEKIVIELQEKCSIDPVVEA